MADWSDLPWPVLALISKSITFYLDYIHFRTVCRSWRSAAPRRPHLPLLVGHRFDEGHLLTAFDFFEFTGSGISPLRHHLPETSLGRICCGSSYGWMAFLDPTFDIDLWNPLTKSHIRLPTLASCFPDIDLSSTGGKLVLSHRNGGRYMRITATSFKPFQKYVATKVILSSDPSVDPDCLVLLLHCLSTRVAVCRIGDNAWAPVRDHVLSGQDAVFYRGRFHIASGQALYVLNLGPEPEVERILMSNPPFDEGPCSLKVDPHFLLESSGDLLLVNGYNRGSIPYVNKEYSFEVYKVDWGMHRIKLLKLRSLGDRALFLGMNQSFSLPTSDLLGCRSNCFYMAEFYHTGETNIWVHDMEDGCNRLIYSADRTSLSLPCVWLTPSLLQ